jgi:hypothetical protein
VGEKNPRSYGLFFWLLAMGGAAVSLTVWLFFMHSSSERDTYGLYPATLAAAPKPAGARPAAPSFLELTSSENPTIQRAVLPGDSNSVIGSARAESAVRVAAAAKAQGGRREAAASTLKEAAIKYQGLVENFILRMEGKYPSLTRYGQEWAASPELSAIRDQYWQDNDPLKFIKSLGKSEDFSRLIGRYAGDPGVHAVITQGLKEAPPDLVAAASEVLVADKETGALVAKITQEAGLPAGLTNALTGDTSEPPDPDKILSDILKSKAVAPR